MSANVWAALLALGLVAGTALLHYEILKVVSAMLPRLKMAHRPRMLFVVAALVLAHFLEICLYAAAYYGMHHHFGLGRLAGEVEGGFADFVYFSMTSYTTLGVGDLFPRGPMRLVSGVEAFNGLVLIGWSASYTYLVLRKLRDDV